jgi:hypothetical protein
MSYVGANIYYWGKQEQRQLLLEGVRPWALEARNRGLSSSLWYCHFDARSPHLFVLLGAAPESQMSLTSYLQAEIASFLFSRPSTATISREDLEQRHKECRGKSLCAADREEGLVDNNSFFVFDHEPGAYPSWLSDGMAAKREFWNSMDRLTFWALRQLEEGNGAKAAIRWLAGVDQAMRRQGVRNADYWALHAGTLIPSIRQRLETSPKGVEADLQHVITKQNFELFSAAWKQIKNGWEIGFDVDSLVQMVLAKDGREPELCFQVLREVNHTLLQQLGQAVRFHIPIILFAWQINLSA